jgi:hypothetical protein
MTVSASDAAPIEEPKLGEASKSDDRQFEVKQSSGKNVHI